MRWVQRSASGVGIRARLRRHYAMLSCLMVMAGLLGLGTMAWGSDSPLAFVQRNVERVVAALEDPAFQGEENRQRRRDELARITDSFFDPMELARRSLGQHWRMFSESEQQEFAALFVELIKQTYLDKFDAYNNQGVHYEQEIFQSPTQALVRLSVTTDKGPLRVEVALIQGPSGWRAFDITVENISLVRNFRTQFQSILQSSPPQRLIHILKEKVHAPLR